MTKTCQKILLGIFVMLTVAAQSQPRGWRGIVPLHSTRADVIRLLGAPNIEGGLYDVDDKTIDIEYSDGPCEKGSSGWKVPRDTIISISVAPNKDLKVSDLHIDETKYKKSRDGEQPEIFYYTNEAEGITVSVSHGHVRNIYYTPSSRDSYLRCPCPEPPARNNKTPTFQRIDKARSTKWDD